LFKIVTAVLFLAVLFAVPVFTKLSKNAEVSYFEYRELAKPPVLTSAATLFDPAYYTAWDTYFADHIWQRENLMTLQTHLNMNILKRPVVNGEIIQDGLLLPFIGYGREEVDNLRYHAENMSDTLKGLDELVTNCGGEFTYVLVPEQYSFFRDRYPEYLYNNEVWLTDAETFLTEGLTERGISYLSMRQEFSGDENYSRTDHHFSYQGAYSTYLAMLEKLNASRTDPLPIFTDFVMINVENPFYGSRNRKLYNLYPSDERLSYYTEETPLPIRRVDNGWRNDYPVFDLPKTDTEPVTYGIYMGGDIAETVIQTDRPELPSALIFGDSFTNPVETFLYHSFNETRSIDLRYKPEDFSLLGYIKEFKPDYVFCLRDDINCLSVLGNGRIE
jgi:hypothetical protein